MMITSKFLEAVRFATLKHAKQKRAASNRTWVPYMVHPIEAAQILVDCNIQEEDILIAAILHDVLEDTDATESEILFKFGQQVLDFVKENTDDPALDRLAQKRMQVVNAAKKGYGAAMIKAADKTSNMRDIVRVPPPWGPEKTRAYVEQAREVVKNLTITDPLRAFFWQASQEALDSVAEAELRGTTEKPNVGF